MEFSLNRRGQLTVIILLAIVMLLVALLAFYLMSYTGIKKPTDDISNVPVIVENCLDITSDVALVILGRQGGKQLIDPYSEDLNTSYLYLEGNNLVPTKEEVEDYLSDYIEANINECIKDFHNLRKRGITVHEISPMEITTTLTENNILFEISYPIKEVQADKEIRHTKFKPVMKQLRMKNILDVSSAIVDSRINNNGLIDLDIHCDVDVTFFPYNQELVTVIQDPSYLMEDEPYTFVFAHKD